MNKGRSKGKRISQRMVIIGIGALAMIGVTVFFPSHIQKTDIITRTDNDSHLPSEEA